MDGHRVTEVVRSLKIIDDYFLLPAPAFAKRARNGGAPETRHGTEAIAELRIRKNTDGQLARLTVRMRVLNIQ